MSARTDEAAQAAIGAAAREQRGHLRQRHQMAAAEPTDLTLHPALLVRPILAWLAEERVKPVVAAQRDEPVSTAAI